MRVVLYSTAKSIQTFFVKGLLTVKVGLTYAVAENNGENHSYPHSGQGRALPGAIFR